MKKIVFLKFDKIKWKQVADISGNLLLFVVVCLTSSVIFAVDYRLQEPNETAKFIKLVSLIPVISILGVVFALVKRNVKFSLLDLFSLFFLVYWFISVFVRGSGNPIYILLPIALTAIYILVKVSASRDADGLKWVAFALLCVSIFEMVLGLKQISGYSDSNHYQFSVTGSFFNPGPFGGYLAFIFALSLSIIVKLRKKGGKLLHFIKSRQVKKLLCIDVPLYFFSFATIFLSLILIPATLSRSAWMAVCVVLLMTFIEVGALNKVRKWLSNRKLMRIPLFLTATVLVVLSIIGVYSLKKGSVDSRLFSWQVSAKIVATNPVTGVGIGYFGGAYADQQSYYFIENPESEYLYIADCPAYTFNEYLQMGTELGLVGFALFLLIIITALWNLFEKSNLFHYGLISILVFAFTSYPFHLVPLLILITVSIATQKSRELSSNLTGRILFTILSITAFSVWLNTRPLMKENIKAQTEWRRLHTLYGMEIYDMLGYQEFYSTLEYDCKFLFEYGHSLNKVGEYEKSNEILRYGTALSNDPMFYNIMGNNYLALKEYKNAEDSYMMAYHIVPSRIYPLYLLAKLLIEKGDNANALGLCRKILEFTPKVHSPAVLEIKAEVKELIYNLETTKR